MKSYFQNLNNFPTSRTIKEMRKYAEINNVPIINDESLIFMLQLVDLMKPKRFLEIGTAIGFCAINLATYDPSLQIDTIEKNEAMFSLALKYIKNSKTQDSINVYLADALDFDTDQLATSYDIIFIDAAKSQYIHFFEKYEKLLSDDGIIVSDNLLFHGFVNQGKTIESRNLRQLVGKIENYNLYLSKNKNYRTNFLTIGDGIALSQRVKK
jgi:predicted O-methyltransferase YrrM